MAASDPLPEVQGNLERWSLATRLLLPAVAAARQHVGISEQVFRTHTFHSMPESSSFGRRWTRSSRRASS